MSVNRLAVYAPSWDASKAVPPPAAAAPPAPAGFVLLPIYAVGAIGLVAPLTCHAALYQDAYARAREAVNRYWFSDGDGI